MKWLPLKACMLLMLALCAAAQADVRLAPIFSDHMVLQRGKQLPIWGTAAPGELVAVQLGARRASATADPQGKWRVKLDALPTDAAEPIELRADGKLNTAVVRDIRPGEVWLCAGQSNMAWPVRSALEGPKEVQQADFPQIRVFRVGKRASEKPEDEASGRWSVCSPQTAGEFSAVQYFFARELHRTLKTPIGIIDASSMSSCSEAFADVDLLRADPLTRPAVERFEADLPKFKSAYPEYLQRLAEYRKAALIDDPGDTKSSLGWNSPGFDDSSWKTVALPAKFDEAFDGVMWFRREVTIPANWAGKELLLSLGSIDDSDVTWFNGQRIGATTRDLSDNRRQVDRIYVVPASLIKPGRNVIAIRTFDLFGTGGLLGPADAVTLQPRKNPDQFIALGTDWKQSTEYEVQPRTNVPAMPIEPPGPNTSAAPGSIYNGMIRPLAGFAIKGAAFYDGEMNVSRGYAYRGVCLAEINSIRRDWNDPKLPSLIVQAANFQTRNPPERGSALAELRESQFVVAHTTPQCALAVTIDVGDPGDIHPRNKQDVGKRLALAGLKTAYAADVYSNGPIYKSFKLEDAAIRITFEATTCALVAKNGKLQGFTIAGDDRRFHPAVAEISGQAILVRSPDVPKPAAVRYAWDDAPEATLYNSENLPAIPFRTDNWPGATADVR